MSTISFVESRPAVDLEAHVLRPVPPPSNRSLFRIPVAAAGAARLAADLVERAREGRPGAQVFRATLGSLVRSDGRRILQDAFAVFTDDPRVVLLSRLMGQSLAATVSPGRLAEETLKLGSGLRHAVLGTMTVPGLDPSAIRPVPTTPEQEDDLVRDLQAEKPSFLWVASDGVTDKLLRRLEGPVLIDLRRSGATEPGLVAFGWTAFVVLLRCVFRPVDPAPAAAVDREVPNLVEAASRRT